MPSGHVDTSKLKPLTPHAKGELLRIARNHVLPYQVNAGVLDRLFRGGLIKEWRGGHELELTPEGYAELKP